ncbi:heterokaryon incompatibility protein-domain-containing protein [Nemania sp. NC0429]|nr:heterokaryon incompatibility protein-domain-containing protein [Nemania sp. NC0429]
MLAQDISSSKLNPNTIIHARVSCNQPRVTWSISLYLEYTSGGKVFYGRTYFFYIYAERGAPANCSIPRQVPNLDPTSETSFQTARKWLSDCQDNHPGCRKQTDEIRPTRLLKIPERKDEVDILSLVDAESEHSYVALSYCWGKDQPCKLTKQRLQEGGVFKTIDLPQTILDAINVTRKLNITYMWIDALCIVQDDPESMQVELGKMPAIYSNATVTVSAASAATCDDGFLNPRNAVDFNRITFRMPVQLSEGETRFVFLAPWEERIQLKSMAKEPINDRAWTLQEHVVSPRVLYYSFQQLHWICRKGILADGGFYPADRDKPWKGSDIYRIFTLSEATTDMVDPSMSTSLASSLNPHPSPEYDGWRRNWTNLLQDYQARRLTNLDDMLVAVSSVGTLFARYMHTEFVAGLFERDLGIDLLWKRANSSEAQIRPTKYRAPSWSWASINSKTENHIMNKELRVLDDVTIQVLPWPDQHPLTPQARMGLVPINLRIRAWVTTATILRKEGLETELKGQQWNLPTSNMTHSFDARDTELDTHLETDVALIEVYWFPESPGTRGATSVPGAKFAGLIARKEEHDIYRRLGYFNMQIPSDPSIGRRAARRQRRQRETVRDSMKSQLVTITLV